MAVTVTVRDETATGNVFGERPLELPDDRLTVRELIRERVYQEVQDFNRASGESVFRGLVQPIDTECVLNGHQSEYRLKQRRQIDWREQFDKAIGAFDRNGFFILIDDSQAESLDQVFLVNSRTEISFVKLTILAGG